MDYITKSLLKLTLGVLLTPIVFAGDNLIHVDQVASGDINIYIKQVN